MRVVSNVVELQRSEQDCGFGPAPAFQSDEATDLSRRLDAAVSSSQDGISRTVTLRSAAVLARQVSVASRVRRKARSRRRVPDDVRPASTGTSRADPLAATIAVARACRTLSGIEFFDVGRRSMSPAVQLAALAQWGSQPDGADKGAQDRTARTSSKATAASEALDPSRLHLYTSSRGDWHLVRLVGELDLFDADRVRQLLVDQAGSTVVLDLTDLRFVDAAGVAAILSAYRQITASGNDLTVRGARGIVRRVFEITELGYLLPD